MTGRSTVRATKAALALLLSSGCVLELQHEVACGDGFVDEAAGEQCDPGVAASFFSACLAIGRPNGHGECDRETCEIIADEVQCAHCGDAIIDFAAGEECDGSNIGAQCWGDGRPTCTDECRLDFSTCDPCGNGIVDEGEECDDPPGGSGGIVVARPCSGSDDVPPLASPYVSTPYTSGSAVACLDDCTYDRSSCGYCGNGSQDGPMFVSLDFQSRAEVCDGEDFDLGKLAEDFPLCAGLGARANVECASDCLSVIERDGPACCLGKQAPCPADGDGLRCCYEYAHPEADDACLPVLVPNGSGADDEGYAVVCR